MTQESGIQSPGMPGLQELINLLIPWAHNKELAHCSPAPGAMFVVSAAAVCRPGLISRSMSVLPLCWRHRQAGAQRRGLVCVDSGEGHCGMQEQLQSFPRWLNCRTSVIFTSVTFTWTGLSVQIEGGHMNITGTLHSPTKYRKHGEQVWTE